MQRLQYDIAAHSAGCILATYALSSLPEDTFQKVFLSASPLQQQQQARLLDELCMPRDRVFLMASAVDLAILAAQVHDAFVR